MPGPEAFSLCLENQTPGFLLLSPLDTAWTVFQPQQEVRCFPVYRKKRMPYVWRVGLKLTPTPVRKAAALRTDGVGVVKQI